MLFAWSKITVWYLYCDWVVPQFFAILKRYPYLTEMRKFNLKQCEINELNQVLQQDCFGLVLLFIGNLFMVNCNLSVNLNFYDLENPTKLFKKLIYLQ